MQRLRRMKRVRQGGLFDLPDQMKWLSDKGCPLETLSLAVDFEVFRQVLEVISHVPVPVFEDRRKQAEIASQGPPKQSPVRLASPRAAGVAKRRVTTERRWLLRVSSLRPCWARWAMTRTTAAF